MTDPLKALIEGWDYHTAGQSAQLLVDYIGVVSSYSDCYRVTTNAMADRCKHSVISMGSSADCLNMGYGSTHTTVNQVSMFQFYMEIKFIFYQKCIVTFTESDLVSFPWHSRAVWL